MKSLLRWSGHRDTACPDRQPRPDGQAPSGGQGPSGRRAQPDRRAYAKRRRAVLVPAAAVLAVAALTVALSGWRASLPAELSPDGGSIPADTGASAPAHAVTASKAGFSSIILPDLLVVLPAGLSSSQLKRLREIAGVRKMITFDGAQITVDGAAASVIGVRPSQFRSWVPLRTASAQALWTHLASGSFIAATSAATRLRLAGDGRYQLIGASAVQVPFGGAARLDIAGIDLVVNESVSRELGLVHQVAALISAPGRAIDPLLSAVRRVLGSAAKLVSLRDAGQGTGSVAPSHITSYLQLFQASSAKYCPALSWTVLAAIGQIESADGQNVGPSSAGALGPMQFLPSTWAAWGIDGFGRTGTPDVMNPFDAVPSAARMLCADGAGSGTEAGLRDAIFDYNHADWYVNEVLALAGQYAAEYR